MKSEIINNIKNILLTDERVVFAYLYGSSLSSDIPSDIDIAIYAKVEDSSSFFPLPSDLKVELSRVTNIPPDTFDVKVINDLIRSDDAFALFYLKDALNGLLLVDKDFDLRGDFIERFSMKYRESEGILSEVLYVSHR
ncbi:MAG: hypothetical protein AB1488_03290 [Nitrospirota bacterium]